MLAELCLEEIWVTFDISPHVYDSLIAEISIKSRFSETVLNLVIVSNKHFESVNISVDTLRFSMDPKSSAIANTKSKT